MRTINLLSLLLLLAAVSCTEHAPDKQVEVKVYSLRFQNSSVDIEEYTIDSCQYIGDLSGDPRGYWLTHKGNCANPIHVK